MGWLFAVGGLLVGYALGKLLGVWPWDIEFRSPFKSDE